MDSPTRTVCPWKGVAWYYLIEVEGEVVPDGAWYHPHPWLIARLLGIMDHVAFYPDVRIERD